MVAKINYMVTLSHGQGKKLLSFLSSKKLWKEIGIEQDLELDLPCDDQQLRIQGGFEGFDEPPLAGESLCTTTPHVDNIKTNCFSCPSCIILLFQVPQTLSSYRQ